MQIRALTMLALAAATACAAPEVRLHGFVQSVAELGEDAQAPVFGLDRARLVARGPLHERMDLFLQVDFARLILPAGSAQTDKDGDSPALIKDARLGVALPGGHKLFFGKFKTPLGREFNRPGFDLDFVKRGFGHQALVFERNLGALWQSPALGDLGLRARLGAFNAGPSGATGTGDPEEGADLSWAGSIGGEPLAGLELLGYGGLATTSVVDTAGVAQEDVSLFGAAAVWSRGPLGLAGEWIARDDPDHAARDGSTAYAQLAWNLTPWLQPAIRYETLDVEDDAKDRADLVFGLNLFFNPESPSEAKMMLNVVRSDLDGASGVLLLVQGSF